MRVWQNVVVTNPSHPRFQTAGTVVASNPQTHPDTVVVQFDTDSPVGTTDDLLPGSKESVSIADLKAL